MLFRRNLKFLQPKICNCSRKGIIEMGLKEQLQTEINQALKSGDQFRRLVLGMVLNAIKNKELGKRTQLSKTVSNVAELERQSLITDEETLEVIAGEVKKRKEAIEQFQKGGRQDLADKEKSEMEILLKYLPQQLTEEEIRTEVGKVVSELGAKDIKDMGRVIAGVMARVRGRAEGSLVSRLVKESLGG